jgi:multicomponent Na+:H+ antiporter subunit F
VVEFLLWSAIAILGVALVGASWRLMRGPSIPDRIVALDLVLYIGVGVLGVLLVITGDRTLLDLAFVAGLVAFLGTVAVARSLEIKGRQG